MNYEKEYLRMFFDESSEYVQILNERILQLEQSSDFDRNIIDTMFRAAHSLKGMSATLGFNNLTNITHKIENLMDLIRQNGNIDSKVIELLFSGIDQVSQIIKSIKRKGEESVNPVEYIERVNYYINSDTISNSDTSEEINKLLLNSTELKSIQENISPTDNIYYITVTLRKDTQLKDVRAYMVLKRLSEIGYIVKSNPDKESLEKEDIIPDLIKIIIVSNLPANDINKDVSTIRDIEQVLIKNMVDNIPENKIINRNTESDTGKDITNDMEKKLWNNSTVRVDINRLDQLINMVGELLINKTRLESLNIRDGVYNEILPQLDRVIMELHHIVMQIRMVPINVIFNRFPRIVRDISKKTGKNINFQIMGENTELDRSIIDELYDPIIHLLRNAVDHGIESTEERAKKGKDKSGTVLLKAYQKGSEIVLEVEDDGCGLDPEFLTEKAVQKGLISREESGKLDLKEKLNLIFLPGFSSRKEVSDLSGRGVGLDIVKNNIENLDGTISIETEKGIGTRFIISLPLTLAITEALMVKIGRDVYAIPLNAINETLVVNRKDIKQLKGEDVIVLRDRTIPLLDSRKSLNLETKHGVYKEKDTISIVTINSGEKLIGLIVDELLNQQEIVVKSLDSFFEETSNISGATIIGDGDVALILDVRSIA